MTEPAEQPRAPIEFRSADVVGVNFAKRVIEVIAVPYDQEAPVQYRGEVWDESFAPGSFDGVEKRPNRVRANRDHDVTRTFGKAVAFWPSRSEGLVAEIRVSQTLLGDETLALADDEVLAASVGFGVRGSDQVLNKPKRRIIRAFLDHLAFTPSPAYEGATVLAVRNGGERVDAATLPPLVTPNLDQWAEYVAARAARTAS